MGTSSSRSTRTVLVIAGRSRRGAGARARRAPDDAAVVQREARTLLAELALDDLLRRRLGKRREDLEVARDREVRQPAVAVVPQLGRVEVDALRHHDAGLDLVLPALLVGGHGDDRDLRDGVVLADHVLDVARRDVLAAAPQAVLDAVDEREAALLVE